MYGKNKYIDNACDHIVKLSTDEMKKLEYDQRFKALCDYNTQMHYNYNKGQFDAIATLYKSGHITLDIAASTLGITEEDFLARLNNK